MSDEERAKAYEKGFNAGWDEALFIVEDEFKNTELEHIISAAIGDIRSEYGAQ